MPLIWGQNSNFIGQNADNHCLVKIVKYIVDETTPQNYRVWFHLRLSAQKVVQE